MSVKIPVTVKGLELLKKELEVLKFEERPSVIQASSDARANGDLSENADYEAAKERQSHIEGRIQELESKISNAEVIDPTKLGLDGRCVFGSYVEIENTDSGEKFTYQIVGEDEADIKQHKLSVNSPIARALIGKYAEDIAEVNAPGGVTEYEILDIRYEQ